MNLQVDLNRMSLEIFRRILQTSLENSTFGIKEGPGFVFLNYGDGLFGLGCRVSVMGLGFRVWGLKGLGP